MATQGKKRSIKGIDIPVFCVDLSQDPNNLNNATATLDNHSSISSRLHSLTLPPVQSRHHRRLEWQHKPISITPHYNGLSNLPQLGLTPSSWRSEERSRWLEEEQKLASHHRIHPQCCIVTHCFIPKKIGIAIKEEESQTSQELLI